MAAILPGDLQQSLFRERVEGALGRVRQILDSTRAPQLPANVAHRYDDKFSLAEFLSNAGLAALLNALERVGVDAGALRAMIAWAAQHRSVTLRLQCQQTCTFDRSDNRDVDASERLVRTTTRTGTPGLRELHSAEQSEVKVVTTVVEHVWNLSMQWEITVFAGTESDREQRVSLERGECSCKLVTTGERKHPPKPASREDPPLDVDLTWLLLQISNDLQLHFKIDRSADTCRTPRRNDEVEKAVVFFHRFCKWCDDVERRLSESALCGDRAHLIDKACLFLPVLPLLEDMPEPSSSSLPSVTATVPESTCVSLPVVVSEPNGGKEERGSGELTARMLSVGDLTLFLAEQRRSIAELCVSIDTAFSEEKRSGVEQQGTCSDRLLTSKEVRMVLMVSHARDVAAQSIDGLDYIEWMLTSQLTAAIGKQLKAADFENHMIRHNQKVFKPEFVPVPFCYAVRRPGHAPDGSLAIEIGSREGGNSTGVCGEGEGQPVYTHVARIPSEAAMSFAINASTRVSFTGERRLHALVAQQFGEEACAPPILTAPLSLVARARQFSSFLLMVGKMGSCDSFEPAAAIILQNKDELTIPLLLDQLPTPAAFRDAIHSLSPEQQRFARAFRDMQLSSSVFGILVIQLKPQLEKVLKLPRDSLTKEIRLTQDLLSLFIDYQVPTDLLTFDHPSEDWEVVGNAGGRGEGVAAGHGAAQAPVFAVEAVKGHVSSLKKMIEESKAAELAEQKNRADFEKALANTADPFAGSAGSAREGAVDRWGGRAPIKEGDMFGVMMCDAAFAAAPAVPTAPGSLLMKMRGVPSPPADFSRSSGSSSFARCSTSNVSAPPPPPPPPPAAQQQQQQQQQQQAIAAETQKGKAQREVQRSESRGHDVSSDDASGVEDTSTVDVTMVPRKLDAKLEAMDKDSAVRPTVIKTGKVWVKKTQPHLLGKPVSAVLDSAAQEAEKNKAFDLLDALSLSGALAIEGTELHVIVAATHRFDKALIDTVVQDNISPIDKLERSTIVVASTIHNVPPEQLLLPQHASRAAFALAR